MTAGPSKLKLGSIRRPTTCKATAVLVTLQYSWLFTSLLPHLKAHTELCTSVPSAPRTMQAVGLLNGWLSAPMELLSCMKLYKLGGIRKGNVEFWQGISVYKDSEIISSPFPFSFQSSSCYLLYCLHSKVMVNLNFFSFLALKKCVTLSYPFTLPFYSLKLFWWNNTLT